MGEAQVSSGYYAVIATSTLKPMSAKVHRQYVSMVDRMMELARKQDGFIGREHARDESLGISVSYWTTKEAIYAWRDHVRHVPVKAFGRRNVYDTWTIRICRVETEYGSDQPRTAETDRILNDDR